MRVLLALLLLIPSLSWGLGKDELKEELKYWKSLLDDKLISQEDYDLKKNELLNIQVNSTNTAEVDQEFVNYVKEEIANPQEYISYMLLKCMLENESEVPARFKTYVKDKKGFGKEGFESEDKLPPTILMDFENFYKNYCM